MQLEYESNRLFLRICNEEYASRLLTFQNANRDFFSRWEPKRHDNFYTLAFQQQVLYAEFQASLKGSYLRYYLFRKETPENIIGTISFSHISLGEDRSCHIGYKLDEAFNGCGYAKEALELLLSELHQDLRVHRVEADIMPQNLPSIHLAERLGFIYEGIAHSSHQINGRFEDHLRYALIFP